eukprot:scaffold2693_cov139-Isochrysis_galbana.AAC.2
MRAVGGGGGESGSAARRAHLCLCICAPMAPICRCRSCAPAGEEGRQWFLGTTTNRRARSRTFCGAPSWAAITRSAWRLAGKPAAGKPAATPPCHMPCANTQHPHMRLDLSASVLAPAAVLSPQPLVVFITPQPHEWLEMCSQLQLHAPRPRITHHRQKNTRGKRSGRGSASSSSDDDGDDSSTEVDSNNENNEDDDDARRGSGGGDKKEGEGGDEDGDSNCSGSDSDNLLEKAVQRTAAAAAADRGGPSRQQPLACGSMSCMVGPSWPHIACMC